VLDAWAYAAGVQLAFIRPVKPNENAYIESFNGKFRDECLNERWFLSMAHAREVTHSSLGNRTPEEFALAISEGQRKAYLYPQTLNSRRTKTGVRSPVAERALGNHAGRIRLDDIASADGNPARHRCRAG
jgi:hypothetical protein